MILDHHEFRSRFFFEFNLQKLDFRMLGAIPQVHKRIASGMKTLQFYFQ